MLIFGNSQRYPDDSAESFIRQNLSPYCALWLSHQSEALGQTRTVILQQIMKEWLTIHARDVPEKLDVDVPEVARQAVAEFIVRHHEEFLPVGGERGREDW
jgi:hypothetical protein